MGNSSINGPFSMAMLNNQRVHLFTVGCVMAVVEEFQSCTYKFLNDNCEDGIVIVMVTMMMLRSMMIMMTKLMEMAILCNIYFHPDCKGKNPRVRVSL